MYSLLVDVTACTACEKCVQACVLKNDLDPSRAEHDRAVTRDGLSGDRFSTVLEIEPGRFARKSCMHCLEPSCVSACLVGGLSKSPDGPVIYDRDKCIGCRYCMLACPFHIPRYEWDETIPYMAKCNMCADRLAENRIPACVEACPQGALKFGTREAMLAEAKKRLASHPDLYVQHIWGEQEFGGTSVLYISDVDLSALDWPTPQTVPIPSLTEPLVHKTPFIGLTVAVGLVGLNWIVKRRNRLAEENAAARNANITEIKKDDDHE